jgi:hypothetical protein
MTTPHLPRKSRLTWQQARLRRLLAAQKEGNINDRQLMRLRQLTVSVSNLIKSKPKARK